MSEEQTQTLSAPRGQGRFLLWIVTGFAAIVLGAWLFRSPETEHIEGEGEMMETWSPLDEAEGVEDDSSYTYLALRKKMDQRFDLNFQGVHFVQVLYWIEKQVDLKFDVTGVSDKLQNVNVLANGEPLREILGRLAFDRGMAVALIEDTVVFVPASQTEADGKYQGECTVETRENLPVELYLGAGGQFRLRLMAEKPLEEGGFENPAACPLNIAFYRAGDLAGAYSLEVPLVEWTPVELAGVPQAALKTRVTPAEGNALAIGVDFLYK